MISHWKNVLIIKHLIGSRCWSFYLLGASQQLQGLTTKNKANDVVKECFKFQL